MTGAPTPGTTDVDRLARLSRRLYWAAIGQVEHADQEPSPVSLAAWGQVVAMLTVGRPTAPMPVVAQANECARCGGTGFEKPEPDESDERSYPCQSCAGTGEDTRLLPARPDAPTCTCYPHGFTPETYEGPQPWCDAHGLPSVAWAQGVAEGARQAAEMARLAAPPAADDAAAVEPEWMRGRCECYPAGEMFGPEPASAWGCPQHGAEASAWRAGRDAQQQARR